MQRREFICASTGVLLGAPLLVRGAKKKIRIGQIGTGHSHASGKLAAIRNLSEDFELVGIAQPREEAKKIIPQSGVYSGIKRMSEEELLSTAGLDAVAIETEVPGLVSAAKRAVSAGLHIHHDKPGGTNFTDFQDLINLARRKKRIVQMGYMLRYNPAFTFMYRAVKEGWLGEIMEVDAMMGKMASASLRKELARYPGGGMFELACHLIQKGHDILSLNHDDIDIKEVDVISLQEERLIFSKTDTIILENENEINDMKIDFLQENRILDSIHEYMGNNKLQGNFYYYKCKVFLGRGKPRIKILKKKYKEDLIDKVEEIC